MVGQCGMLGLLRQSLRFHESLAGGARLASTHTCRGAGLGSLPSLQATTSSNFGHVCIRKMYVLCSRGGGQVADPDGCLLEVRVVAQREGRAQGRQACPHHCAVCLPASTLKCAQNGAYRPPHPHWLPHIASQVSRLALPVFMARCDAVLRTFAEDQARMPPTPQMQPRCAGVAPAAHGRLLQQLHSLHCATTIAPCRLPPPLYYPDSASHGRPRLSPSPHSGPGPSAAAGPSAASAAQRGRLDEVLCILEVLASMTLAPQVADAAMPPSDFLAQVGRSGRAGLGLGRSWAGAWVGGAWPANSRQHVPC